jgi:DNA polymerase I-like protein with 3'-5' exonuclease and polymerase domains
MKSSDREIAREIIFAMLRTRKDTTFKSTYERIAPAPDGCIRTVHSPAGTETGRLNSSETFLEPSTNLQNLSIKFGKLDELYRVKDCIIPPKGRAFGEIDMSQAEARIAAYDAEDLLAIEQYETGVDRYKFLAAAAFYDDPEASDRVTKAQRDAGKMGLLAYQYDVSWKTWMEQTNHMADLTGIVVDAKTAKRIEATFHELWPNYRKWHARLLDEVLTKGYLRNPFGRRRDFFARADTASAIDRLKKEAVAFMPQSTIADAMNGLIIDLHTKHDPDILWVHAQIHDALLFSCPIRDSKRVARLVSDEMTSSLIIHDRVCELPCEVKISTSRWSATKLAA